METPPDYSQYPRGPQASGFGGSGRGYRGPGIYFDYINEAWDMVRKKAAVYVVGALLITIISQVVNLPFSFFNNFILYGNITGPKPGEMPVFKATTIPLLALVFLIPFSVSQVLNVGLSLCGLEDADEGTTKLDTLFSGFKNFVNVALTSVLYCLAIYIGLALCIVPSFYFAGVFAFAPIIAAKEGLGPIQSMQRSYEMLKPHAWPCFGFLFIASLTNLIGFLACCFGVLWTIPIVYVGLALHYREFRGSLNQAYIAPTMPIVP